MHQSEPTFFPFFFQRHSYHGKDLQQRAKKDFRVWSSHWGSGKSGNDNPSQPANLSGRKILRSTRFGGLTCPRKKEERERGRKNALISRSNDNRVEA